jgi:hypothetical protein
MKRKSVVFLLLLKPRETWTYQLRNFFGGVTN